MEKTEFKMTADEFEELMRIGEIPILPAMVFGSYISGDDRQKAINEFWAKLSKKYNFICDTVEPSLEKGGIFFIAKKGGCKS